MKATQKPLAVGSPNDGAPTAQRRVRVAALADMLFEMYTAAELQDSGFISKELYQVVTEDAEIIAESLALARFWSLCGDRGLLQVH
jgi:hypothetical protein